mmetsp:Transcript_54100/g.136700  ORF Transcript_54100/g.136700 Transcript_54100/m.136700 type:complete len:80 (-) Transcript_54100:57-296(-)
MSVSLDESPLEEQSGEEPEFSYEPHFPLRFRRQKTKRTTGMPITPTRRMRGKETVAVEAEVVTLFTLASPPMVSPGNGN